MATPTAKRRRDLARLAGGAFAVLVHGGLLAALLAAVVRPASPPPAPVLEVELVRPDRPPPPPSTEPAQRPPATATPLGPIRPHLPPQPPPLPAPMQAAPAAPRPAQPAPAAPATRPAGDDDVLGRVRSTLRTTIGCDDDPAIALDARERAACARRRGEAARNAPKLPPNERQRAFIPKPERRDAHKELRPEWDCAAGGSLGCRGSAVMVGGSIPFGYVPKALPPIPPSTLRGDDDALRPKTKAPD